MNNIPAAKNILEQNVDPTERTAFIERTGVVMRWILLATCSLIQFVQPVIPYKLFWPILPVCIFYNYLISVYIIKKRDKIFLISRITASLDIIISIVLIFLAAETDIYLWFFVLLVSHAARFGFKGAIISPIIFSFIYVFIIKFRGIDVSAHALFIRSTFFIVTGVVSGYLAREEHRRFNNILKQQQDVFKAQQRRKELRDVLQRYVSYNIVEELLKNPEALTLGGTKKKVSILFSDIEGFTNLLARVEPETVIARLNEYLTEMTNIIFYYGGMVDKFIGDAILGIFGAINPAPEDSLNAVKCAIAMQDKLRELHKKWEADSTTSIHSRIAVNTGEVIMGNVGSPKRMDYTAIGDPVNTASRLQSVAVNGAVVISSSTYNELKDVIEVEDLGMIQLKGKPEPIEVYKILKMKDK